jgi:hypothetical protein
LAEVAGVSVVEEIGVLADLTVVRPALAAASATEFVRTPASSAGATAAVAFAVADSLAEFAEEPAGTAEFDAARAEEFESSGVGLRDLSEAIKPPASKANAAIAAPITSFRRGEI